MSNQSVYYINPTPCRCNVCSCHCQENKHPEKPVFIIDCDRIGARNELEYLRKNNSIFIDRGRIGLAWYKPKKITIPEKKYYYEAHLFGIIAPHKKYTDKNIVFD